MNDKEKIELCNIMLEQISRRLLQSGGIGTINSNEGSLPADYKSMLKLQGLIFAKRAELLNDNITTGLGINEDYTVDGEKFEF